MMHYEVAALGLKPIYTRLVEFRGTGGRKVSGLLPYMVEGIFDSVSPPAAKSDITVPQSIFNCQPLPDLAEQVYHGTGLLSTCHFYYSGPSNS